MTDARTGVNDGVRSTRWSKKANTYKIINKSHYRKSANEI